MEEISLRASEKSNCVTAVILNFAINQLVGENRVDQKRKKIKVSGQLPKFFNQSNTFSLMEELPDFIFSVAFLEYL